MPRPSTHSTKKKPAHFKDAAAAQRALQALELRKAGASYEQISRVCGYASRSGAYQAVQRELQRTMQEPADDVRQLELMRLDDLYRAMVPKALKGDKDSTWYVDRCLAIMDRRAKLLGLDMKPDSAMGTQLALVSVPIAADVLEAI